MRKRFTMGILALCFTTLLCGCASAAQASGAVETLVSDTGAAGQPRRSCSTVTAPF